MTGKKLWKRFLLEYMNWFFLRVCGSNFRENTTKLLFLSAMTNISQIIPEFFVAENIDFSRSTTLTWINSCFFGFYVRCQSTNNIRIRLVFFSLVKFGIMFYFLVYFIEPTIKFELILSKNMKWPENFIQLSSIIILCFSFFHNLFSFQFIIHSFQI